MYIRIQGKQVQCVRSPYDPAKKKCVQKVVVTFPRSYSSYRATAAAQLPPEKLALLTEEEVGQLDAWLSKQAAARLAESQDWKLGYGGDTIKGIAKAVSERSGDVTPEMASSMWTSIEALSKALKKAGHPHSDFRASKEPKAAAAPGQQDLLASAGDGASAS